MRRKYTFRTFIGDIHQWLGLASGVILFIVCLTGTIYTFNDEILELSDYSKHWITPPASQAPKSLDELIPSLKQKHSGQLVMAIISANPSRSYIIRLRTNPKDRFGTAYFMNQYTGEILGDGDTKTAAFLLWNMNMHRWLNMKDSGGILIVGTATIIFIVLTLSGLVIWFPRKIRHWKQGLKIKYNANWKRLNYDLHNTLGFYALPLLLVMALSGLCWSFEWYSDGMGKIIGTEVWGEYYEKPRQSRITKNAIPMSPGRFFDKTQSLLSYPGHIEMYFPKDSQGVVNVHKRRDGFFALASEDKVDFDQYSGEILKLNLYEAKTSPERLVSMLRPIHIGSIYGMGSKIIYFIACLIAISLPVTGTIIWWNKLRQKKRKKLSKIHELSNLSIKIH